MRATRGTMIIIAFYLYVFQKKCGAAAARTTIHPQLKTARPIPKGQLEADYERWDHMFMQTKRRLTTMAEELLRESLFKIHQISAIRDEHMEIVAFEIGVVTGNILEKYKTMLTFYRQTNDRFRVRTRLLGPRSFEFWPLKYLVYYEFMHHIEMDIMKLLDILEAVPKEMLEMKFKVDDDEDKQEKANIERARQEESYKRETRRKYLIKRLGFLTNESAVIRRFDEDWPGQEQWDRINDNVYT